MSIFKTKNSIIENLIWEVHKLENNNDLLKEELDNKDKLLFEITQKNAHLSDRVEELEKSNEKTMTLDEVKNRESDIYMQTLMSNTLDKTTEERNIYKKTINIMCDKFGIEHHDVFKIIDSIKAEKQTNAEREQ